MRQIFAAEKVGSARAGCVQNNGGKKASVERVRNLYIKCTPGLLASLWYYAAIRAT